MLVFLEHSERIPMTKHDKKKLYHDVIVKTYDAKNVSDFGLVSAIYLGIILFLLGVFLIMIVSLRKFKQRK